MTRGLISLSNGNDLDNNLKENLVYEYYGSIVNKKKASQAIQIPSHKTTWCGQTLNRGISWHNSYVKEETERLWP